MVVASDSESDFPWRCRRKANAWILVRRSPVRNLLQRSRLLDVQPASKLDFRRRVEKRGDVAFSHGRVQRVTLLFPLADAAEDSFGRCDRGVERDCFDQQRVSVLGCDLPDRFGAGWLARAKSDSVLSLSFMNH